MSDLWEDLNGEVPKYFSDLTKKFSLEFIKINKIRTALVCKRYALIIAIDRFYIDVYYLYKNGKDFVMHSCGNYFAEKYDDDDRVNLLRGEGAGICVRNSMIITANGLMSKWEHVLLGSLEWINDFKNSKWYNKEGILPDELEIIRRYLKQ